MTTVNRCPLPNNSAELAHKHVLIWGVGSYGGGLGSALFCAAHGARVSILELKQATELSKAAAIAQEHGWDWHVGDRDHPLLQSVDLILASPAIPPRALPTEPQLCEKITSDLSLFFALHRGKRLGITGTKGKSSTANICGHLLDWPVIGNSHQSVLQYLLNHPIDSNVLIELSSFQLWYLQTRQFTLDCGIITNIDQDHLDWHQSLEEYHSCKSLVRQRAAHCVETHNAAVHLVNNNYADAHGPLAPQQDASSPAQQTNTCLAIAAALALDVDRDAIAQRLAQVKPLAHRFETVHTCQAISFINDSAATTPIALLDALQRSQTSSAETAIYILGGHDKGGDFSAVAAYIREHQIPCILLGQAAATLSAAGIHGPICESLEAAMETAMQDRPLHSPCTIILSPGCASFGLFSSYIERGERFAAFARLRWSDGVQA